MKEIDGTKFYELTEHKRKVLSQTIEYDYTIKFIKDSKINEEDKKIILSILRDEKKRLRIEELKWKN